MAVVCGIGAAEDQAKPNAAEELFRKFEEKVAAAKTVRVVCKAREPREGGDRHDGMFVVGEGGKARVEFDWAGAGGKTWKEAYVCDGAKAWSSKRAPAACASAAKLGPALVRGFARAGIAALSAVAPSFESGKEPPAGDSWKVSKFEVGEKAKEKDRELQAVKYVLNEGKPDEQKMTLWLDVKTLLPARRDVDIGGWKLTETFEAFELDGRIDEGVFAPPAKK